MPTHRSWQKQDGLLKPPPFVCLKYKLKDEVVNFEVVLPGIARNEDRILNLDLEDPVSLCARIYKLWFGLTAYVDDKGRHWVYEEDVDKTVNCVHIIHAGEDKQLLRDLSDALEENANLEISCEFRRRFREGDDRKTKILDDVKTFVSSLENEQNKCLIIVSDRLVDVLIYTPELQEIRKVLFADCFKYSGNVPTFVLVKTLDTNMFSDFTFKPIILNYRNDWQTIAKDALDVWFKPTKMPLESCDSSGELETPIRQQIQQRVHCTCGTVNQKCLVPSHESLSSQISALRHDQPSQNGFQTPIGHIPTEYPDDLLSNPPPLICQPLDLSADGNVAVNTSSTSLDKDYMIPRPSISLETLIRNSNHCNVDVIIGQLSNPETQRNKPSYQYPAIKSLPSGTKPCRLEPAIKSLPFGTKLCRGEPDKNFQDANENSTESPDSKSGAKGGNVADEVLVIELKKECRKELIQRLDLPIPCVHDWRNLASHYGVPNTTIHVWSSKMSYFSASEALLSWLGTFNPDLKVETLKQDLGNFRRRDTLKILEKHGY